MTEAVFQAPKRRARVYESYEAPFPVPTNAEEAKQQEYKVYTAEMINQNIIVRDPDHIQAIYGKGYFGKGILSRSRPLYSISDQWEDLGYRSLPVISSSKYQLHLDWARGFLQAQGLDDESISQTLEKYINPVELPSTDKTAEKNGGSNGMEGSPREDKREAEEPKSSSCSPSTDTGRLSGPQCGSQSKSPERKKARRQGDRQFDPLADIYPEEPEEIDAEALHAVKCEKHDDWLVHCGCRLKDSVLVTVLKNKPEAHRPAFSPGCEYVLVKEEEAHPGENDDSCDSTQRTERLVCRMNPFRMIEYLQLSLEEAFFLVYALGCLSIYYNEEPLTILSLWEIFSSIQPNFQTSYVAYHYFRSKGWVPKVGMKYGTDLLLYRKGPAFYHASYSVVVERVDDTLRGAALRPFSWRSLAALSRITGNVSKELMLCYVIWPLDMTEEERCSPECLKRIRVQEIIVSRWVSSRERTEQEEI
ncbi:SEN2 endonuclease, partial [Amia calva]|nr:SEN2 endonuclease [Amia calva]